MHNPAEAVPPPWMTADHTALFDAAARFAREVIAPNEERWRHEHRVDLATWRKAGDLGLLATDIPVEYGGAGGDFSHEAMIYRGMAEAADSGFLVGRGVHSIVAGYLMEHGTPAQKSEWLPRLASGESVGAIAMTEPGAGSDLKGMATRAELRDGRYVLQGTKTYISNALNMGLLIVAARTQGPGGAGGITLFLLDPRGMPGLTVGRVLDKMGLHSQDTCELFFEDCRLGADAVLGGEPGRGLHQLMGQLPVERSILGVTAAAQMAHAVRITYAYARERKAFGQAVGQFQHIRFRLAELLTRSAAATVFMDHVVQMRLLGKLDAATASMAKWWVTDTYCNVVDECLQVFGGAGYMNDYPIARMYADARVMKIFAGTNEIMKELIARWADASA